MYKMDATDTYTHTHVCRHERKLCGIGRKAIFCCAV